MEEARGNMIALLSLIAREAHEGNLPNDVNRLTVRPVTQALDYISGHYMEPVKVEDMSAWCHMSETHFRRIFSQHMNMSPLEYLNLIRVHTACDYLKKTDISVAEIAEKCGFTTLSTFNRNFRQVTGMSPSEWRKQPENFEQQLFRFKIHSEEGW
jgi:AraC-like DNA-binding protein